MNANKRMQTQKVLNKKVGKEKETMMKKFDNETVFPSNRNQKQVSILSISLHLEGYKKS